MVRALPAADLTATTIRYLFASTWAPPAEKGRTMHVPGLVVDGIGMAANLLDIAVWSLREQGLVEVEQLGPVESERVTVMGGHSFAAVRALGQGAELPGLEGALLAKIRERPEEGFLGRFDDWLAKRLSGDHEDGLRGHILHLGLASRSPWVSVGNYCLDEARDAGLIEVQGRVRKKMRIADPAGIDALAGRNDEIAAARAKYREKESELDGAVISDCVAALHWAHQTPSD
jgi:hypothetical protein